MTRPWRIRIRRPNGDNCNHLSDLDCSLCKADAARDAARPLQKPALHFFGEEVYEHMYHPWETPVPISSAEELRQEAHKRGVIPHRLRDSLVHKTDVTRWV